MTTQLQCPSCYSTNLRVVGCYVYSAEGAPITPDFSFLDFKGSDAFTSKKLLQCNDCNKYAPWEDVAKGTLLAEAAIYWETSINGRKHPLICPVCNNNKTFIQERLLLLEQSHQVTVQEDKTLELSEFMTDDNRETITLRYLCNVDGCTGIITINEDTFKVTSL
jgi:Zn finger protein HypA/HybF involved in hydrogenase expression